MERKITQKLPPRSWFQVYEPTDSASIIGMSEEFRSKGNGEIGVRMNQWILYTNILSTQAAFSRQDKKMYEDTLKEAERLITQATGFTPQEIWNRVVAIHQEIEASKSRPNLNGKNFLKGQST